MKRSMFAGVFCLALVAVACTGGGSSDGGGSSSGPVKLTFAAEWTGQTKVITDQLVQQWNTAHPDIQVEMSNYGSADYALTKIETQLAGGDAPDIAYLYGSYAGKVASVPQAVKLNSYINKDPSFDWNDFWPAERLAATVDGQIIGIPALIDNLALVYNKKLFDAAGLDYPTPDWTWQDFRDAAKQLTDPATHQYGWALNLDGSEDTVWHYDTFLWQAGGDILNSSNTQATFNSAAGIKALTAISDMTNVDHSVYEDNSQGLYSRLFDTNKIAMLYTGPWDLPDFKTHHIDYGVQILPGDLNHQTISGPDNWVIFNNGSARVQAAFEFLSWYTAGEQDIQLAQAAGTLPIRKSEEKLAGYKEYLKAVPGVDVFEANLANAEKARPGIASYPKVSSVMGEAIAQAAYGKMTPADALNQAAEQVNQILASGQT
jgi:multiple sugar transport system substrate-binding protein